MFNSSAGIKADWDNRLFPLAKTTHNWNKIWQARLKIPKIKSENIAKLKKKKGKES